MTVFARLCPSLKRSVIQAVPTMLAVVILGFVLLKLAPGDAVDVLAAESGIASMEGMARLREYFGLDKSTFTQLLTYLNNLAHFELGVSPRFNAPVADLILSRLPYTMLVMIGGVVVALIFGVAMGVIMAVFANRWPDRLLRAVVLTFYSAPSFWVALMLIMLFAVKLNWLPSNGYSTIGAEFTGAGRIVDLLRHAALPIIALSFFSVALYARLVRTSMMEVYSMDFVRTAEAKGVGPTAVAVRHVLRNSLRPLVALVGHDLATMVGGAAVIESVFGWPGIGRLALDSVITRDFAVLMGVLIVLSFFVILSNVITDLVHALLDPRVHE